ncbi:MAG TPA: extracellular solute-binding protein [Candidatus Limnocylindrales bacterium]|nr:extracellular solute-binding protein [Candidatus Limnocylindrales bacterium]
MRAIRAFAAIGVLALVAGACGGTTPTTAPSGGTQPSTGASAPASAPASAAAGVTEIRWYCCLGGGDAPEQVDVEKKVVEEFNTSHPNIHVTFEAVPYAGANDALATEIASGNGPDIVGPVGIGGANAFHGQWLDLAPLIEKTGYDLSGFPPDAVNIYKLDEGQVGIPFAIYPSVLFYAKSLFAEAGLAEPPHQYGTKYTMPDGSQVDWSYDTIKQVAKLLTVDKNGKDATQAGFDPKNIVQWGFEPQRDDLRGMGAYFGAGSLAAADGKTAQIPDAWKAAWQFWYDSMWTDHISMTGPVFSSPDINPEDYPFFTGKIAMSANFLWSTYGLEGLKGDWDMGALPSYNGTVTSAFNADTFRILKGTKHPDEAFEVLTYLLGDAAPELLKTYGGMPARTAEQDAFFASQDETFTQKPDWQVAIDSIQFADNPNFESYMPAYNETLGLVGSGGKYTTKWQTDKGLDMNAEFEALRAEIQAIWDKQ